MGAQCSIDRSQLNEPQESSKTNYGEQSDSSKPFTLDCKSYRDYNNKLETLKTKIKDIIKKVEVINDFSVVKK